MLTNTLPGLTSVNRLLFSFHCFACQGCLKRFKFLVCQLQWEGCWPLTGHPVSQLLPDRCDSTTDVRTLPQCQSSCHLNILEHTVQNESWNGYIWILQGKPVFVFSWDYRVCKLTKPTPRMQIVCFVHHLPLREFSIILTYLVDW